MTAPSGEYVVLVGAPGSGKSSWAAGRYPAEAIVSVDALRVRIAGRHDQAATPYAWAALHAIVAGRLACGQPVVVDAVNADPTERRRLLDHGHTAGVPVALAVFVVPLQVCLDRNADRPADTRVPETWLRQVHAAIGHELPPGGPSPAGVATVTWIDEDGATIASSASTVGDPDRHRDRASLADAQRSTS